MSVATGEEAEAYGDGEIFYQVKQGIRSQREAFISSRTKTALDCVLFCFEQKTCKSFNYADYTSVSDGEENCELHNEIKNDGGNPLEFLKDDRYTFYQIPGASHGPENTQTTENATEQIPGAPHEPENTQTIENATEQIPGTSLEPENIQTTEKATEQIPGTSPEPENIQTTEKATEQVKKPSRKRSCLDHFNHGSKTSGNYIILNQEQKPRTVYCDMKSEPGSVWTLVMSFTRKTEILIHSDRKQCMKVPQRTVILQIGPTTEWAIL
ncbi:Hypothetical predicted protein [Paramuricea clavata]|uniref:Uncharacterized protein n=1 Tax=Paramuricea clavata TaxID=317549 RepID=A0A6S7GU30_PARCT|nr:Hypothetical predicted protein [Paramuricea clavata]